MTKTPDRKVQLTRFENITVEIFALGQEVTRLKNLSVELDVNSKDNNTCVERKKLLTQVIDLKKAEREAIRESLLKGLYNE